MKDYKYYAINHTTGEVLECMAVDDDIDGSYARANLLEWVEVWLRSGDKVEVGEGSPWVD
jgi:hypothetical protein